MSNGAYILIIDDDPQLQKILNVSLSAHGYSVHEALTGADGIKCAAALLPELLIIDLGLPDMDGKTVVKSIRKWSVTPIIVLSARDQEKEKIAALDAGANDYVTKPFGMGELMARVRVSLRSAVGENGAKVICGDLAVDLAARRVTVNETEIKLTPTEYEIIKLLAQHRGKVLTHRQLLESVWGHGYQEDTHYLRVYIGQIRRKIEANPNRPQYIKTESGIGYRLMG